jgi:hypothetical protein
MTRNSGSRDPGPLGRPKRSAKSAGRPSAERRFVLLAREVRQRLTPPMAITWWLALVLGCLGLLGYLGSVAGPSPYSSWLVTAGLVLMLVATRTKNFQLFEAMRN